MPSTLLTDRGVVGVSGDEARSFLNGLFTCDMNRVAPKTPRFGALLSPQGKILFDFIVTEAPRPHEGFRLDVRRTVAADFVKRLNFYKLRAKILIEDMSERFAVVAGWNSPGPLDPRSASLGWRKLAEPDSAAHDASLQDYHAHRIACAVPEGGEDFPWNDAFPHEADMDRLHGVDFDKGCYVGQEVVSRMQHRGTIRTRTVALSFDGKAPPQGTEVTAGGRRLGAFGTSANGRGLALLRLDRLAEAVKAGERIMADEIEVWP